MDLLVHTFLRNFTMTHTFLRLQTQPDLSRSQPRIVSEETPGGTIRKKNVKKKMEKMLMQPAGLIEPF